MILWGTRSPSRSAGFPNKATIPFLKTSSLCPLTKNVRLDSENIHETLAEVSFILDQIHRCHSHNWYLWFKRRYTDGQQAYEKMLSIANSRERKSTLQGRTTSYRSKWPSLDTWWITDAGEGVEKRETLLHCWGSVSWCSHCGKQYDSSLKL